MVNSQGLIRVIRDTYANPMVTFQMACCERILYFDGVSYCFSISYTKLFHVVVLIHML